MPLTRSEARRRAVIQSLTAALIVAILGGWLFVANLERGASVFPVASHVALRKDASIVFLSGDTGLRRWSLGGRVARQLAGEGYGVTGVDTLAAFSTRKTPDQAEALLARAMNAALARNPSVPIVLMGQSFGSDILPIAVERLPPQLQARISRIILIVPGSNAYLQVSPGEMMGRTAADVDLAPLARRLPKVPITCVYGIDEKDSLCPVFDGTPNATVIGLPGGHPLHRDSRAVFAVVSRALRAPPGDGGVKPQGRS